jgi:hypothetical protein
MLPAETSYGEYEKELNSMVLIVGFSMCSYSSRMKTGMRRGGVLAKTW